MQDSVESKQLPENESADQVTKKMVSIGRKRTRGRRFLKILVAFIALAIATIIFGNIYLQTLEPGFEWK